MHSTAWINQFEIKDKCIEFVINNVCPQGNNMKKKLNLKLEKICRNYSPIFCEISDKASGFCLILLKAHLIPRETMCFAKIVNGWIQLPIFAKCSILDVLLGLEYVSDYPGFVYY